MDGSRSASGGGGIAASLLGSGGRISTTVAGAASTRKVEAAAPFVAAAFEAGGWLAGESAPNDSGRRIATSFGGGRPCPARAVAVGTCRRRWLTSAAALGTASGDGA